MAYCVKCGARVEDDLRFCPYCGAEIPVVEKTADRAENTYTAGGSEESQSYTYYQEGTNDVINKKGSFKCKLIYDTDGILVLVLIYQI